MPEQAVDLCDELQNMFLRIMLEVPVSMRKVALRVEVGMPGIKERSWMEKINLAQFIRECGTSSLAGSVYREQMDQAWPGLAREVFDI